MNGNHPTGPAAGEVRACGHLVVRSSIDGHPVDVHHAFPGDGSEHEPSTACDCDPVVLVAEVTEDIDPCVRDAGWHGFLARHRAGR
jgi:hypothetical protein